MSRIVLAPALLALLASCSTGGSGSDRYEGLRSANVFIVRERPNAPEILRNATLRRGSFFLKENCLGLLVEGSAYTPLLPAGSAMEAGGQSLRVGGSAVRMGQQYNLPFANEVEGGVEELRSSLRLPPGCPQRLMSVGAPR